MNRARTAGSAQPAESAAHDGPLVSVVVPVHNAAPWVGETLASILAQTYVNLEVIVMDDASTDRSGEIVAAFDDARVRQHRNERNLGQFANVNAGIRVARGELIAICHADDLYERTFLADQVAYLQAAPEVGAVFAKDSFIDPNGRVFGRLELLRSSPLATCCNTPRCSTASFATGIPFFAPGQASCVARSTKPSADSTTRMGFAATSRCGCASRAPIPSGFSIAISSGTGGVMRMCPEQYERLRSEPELTFAMIDDRLRAGDLAHSPEPQALAAFEGRRAEDAILVAANLYTLRPASQRTRGAR